MSLVYADSNKKAIYEFIKHSGEKVKRGGGNYRMIYNDPSTSRPMLQKFSLHQGGSNMMKLRISPVQSILEEKDFQSGGAYAPGFLGPRPIPVIPVRMLFPGIVPIFPRRSLGSTEYVVEESDEKPMIVCEKSDGIKGKNKNDIEKGIRDFFKGSNYKIVRVRVVQDISTSNLSITFDYIKYEPTGKKKATSEESKTTDETKNKLINELKIKGLIF
jgi:hypothetical protein